jgi:hypothetical protein
MRRRRESGRARTSASRQSKTDQDKKEKKIKNSMFDPKLPCTGL